MLLPIRSTNIHDMNVYPRLLRPRTPTPILSPPLHTPNHPSALLPPSSSPGRLLLRLRQQVLVVGGRVVTGVHVVEGLLAVWALMCVEAAAYIHHHVLVPLLMCWNEQGAGRWDAVGSLVAVEEGHKLLQLCTVPIHPIDFLLQWSDDQECS